MSQAERNHTRAVDRLILEATGEELRRLQEIDRRGQLEARTIYDLLAEYRPSTGKSPRPVPKNHS